MTVYRERITIQKDNSAAGDADPDYTGSTFASSVPADIISTRGDEKFRGRQLEAHVDYVVQMHHRTGILPDMRVKVTTGVYKDSLLNVEYVKTIPYRKGRPPETWLLCTELVDV